MLTFSARNICSKILQETLLNRVFNDLFPFMVGQSHDNSTLQNVKDVTLFQLSAGHPSAMQGCGGYIDHRALKQSVV
jgi:hypothetical protein